MLNDGGRQGDKKAGEEVRETLGDLHPRETIAVSRVVRRGKS